MATFVRNMMRSIVEKIKESYTIATTLEDKSVTPEFVSHLFETGEKRFVKRFIKVPVEASNDQDHQDFYEVMEGIIGDKIDKAQRKRKLIAAIENIVYSFGELLHGGNDSKAGGYLLRLSSEKSVLQDFFLVFPKIKIPKKITSSSTNDTCDGFVASKPLSVLPAMPAVSAMQSCIDLSAPSDPMIVRTDNNTSEEPAGLSGLASRFASDIASLNAGADHGFDHGFDHGYNGYSDYIPSLSERIADRVRFVNHDPHAAQRNSIKARVLSISGALSKRNPVMGEKFELFMMGLMDGEPGFDYEDTLYDLETILEAFGPVRTHSDPARLLGTYSRLSPAIERDDLLDAVRIAKDLNKERKTRVNSLPGWMRSN